MGKSQPVTGRRAEWQTMFSKTLPDLACSKSPVQKRWSVHVDHCFGRIIYDNVIGEGKVQWAERVKAPAIKNMSDEQVEACIELGEKIARGEIDLVQLDEQSLAARGKKSKMKEPGEGKKRKAGDEAEHEGEKLQKTRKQTGIKSSFFQEVKEGKKTISSTTNEHDKPSSQNPPSPSPTPSASDDELAAKAKRTSSLEETQHLVESSDLAPYRKKVLLALLQVPKGHYTTYAKISEFLQSSPRAVGNAMRNNPFAPAVPCHRVLAADGKIGGFGGEWGEGDKVNTKRTILRSEGLKFDGKGRVVGQPWKGFT